MVEEFNFNDDPELFPLSNIIPAGALPPTNNFQPLPLIVFPAVVLPSTLPWNLKSLL